MALVSYLKAREGRIVAIAELSDHVWKGRIVTDDSVYQQIARIRRALGDTTKPHRYVETVPRQGYRLLVQAPDVARENRDETGRISMLLVPIDAIGRRADTEEFAARVTQEIAHELARSSDVQLYLRDEDLPPPVDPGLFDFLIDGSVATSNGRLRCIVRLVRAADGETIWTDAFGGSGEDADDFIAGSVRNVVAMTKMVTAISNNTSRPGSSRGEAGHLFAEAASQIINWSAGRPAAWELVRRSLERALEIDPAFLAAHQFLAVAWATRLGTSVPASIAGPPAREAIAEAIRLAPEHPVTLSALGHIQSQLELDWQQATDTIEQARRAGALASELDNMIGTILMRRGRVEEAVGQFEAALATQPGFGALSTRTGLGAALLLLGRHAAARRILEESLAMSRGQGTHAIRTDMLLAEALYRSGEVDRANEIVNWNLASGEDRQRQSLVGTMALLGRHEEARTVLRAMEDSFDWRRFAPASEAFIAHYHLAEYDAALVWLQRAIEDRQWWLFPALRTSQFPALLDHPGFEAAIERLNQIEAIDPH